MRQHADAPPSQLVSSPWPLSIWQHPPAELLGRCTAVLHPHRGSVLGLHRPVLRLCHHRRSAWSQLFPAIHRSLFWPPSVGTKRVSEGSRSCPLGALTLELNRCVPAFWGPPLPSVAGPALTLCQPPFPQLSSVWRS
jgi:hypothetical protein